MHVLIVAPIVFPMFAAIVLSLTLRHRKAQEFGNLAGSVIFLALCIALLYQVQTYGIISVQIGGWEAPYGITFIADSFSSMMVVIAGVLQLCTAIYSLGSIDEKRERLGYYPLLNIMIMGVCGCFLTGDVFNLYVWFEVMLIASFVLLSLGSSKEQLESSMKYVTLNIISSFILLAGTGFLYTLTGTLNIAHLAFRITEVENTNMVTACGMFFLVAFGIKAALFPLYFWLTASYHTPPPAISAIFAGLLTKVGVYGIIRINSLVFLQVPGFPMQILIILASLSMIIGVLGAVAQHEVRRILAFHKVSQIGYLLLGFAILTPLTVAGSLFYMFHYILVKSNLFFIAGIIEKERSGYLEKTGGLYKSFPLLAMLFLISSLSLSGIPPLSGFWAKFLLIKPLFLADRFLAGTIALVVGIITLMSMTKIWKEVFWKERDPDPQPDPGFSGPHLPGKWLMLFPVILLSILITGIGFFPKYLYAICIQASEQLLDPSAYIRTVLPDRP